MVVSTDSLTHEVVCSWTVIYINRVFDGCIDSLWLDIELYLI